MPKRSFFSKWGSLMVLSLALAIIVIDTTLLNVALATIIRELNTDIQSLQWVITLYSLMLAAFTITGGRLGDFLGRKRMFMLGAAIFAVGSFVASISMSVPILILGEAIIEGVGAVLMLPATASLLVSTYRGRDRAIAFGFWGGIAAAASAIGPILGGYLTSVYSWRWGFRINVVVAALLLTFSFVVRESRDTEEKPQLDWIGVILSAIGLLGIVFGIIEASRYGWWTAKETFVIGTHSIVLLGNLSISILAIVWGLLFLMCFILWEIRMEQRGNVPLVSTRMFKNAQFRSGILTTGVLALGLAGLTFSLPVFFQAVRHLSAFQTGLSLLPLSLAILIAAPFSSILVQKIAPKWLVITGLSLNIVGYIILAFIINANATPLALAPGLAIFGIGMGLTMAQVSNITLSAVSVQQAGEASGINNTIRQLGSTLGSAIIGSILISTISTNITSGIASSGVIPEPLKPQITQIISKQTSNVEFGGGAKLSSTVPQPVVDELSRISRDATTEGNRRALIYASIISLLGILAATQLPKEKNIEHAEKISTTH